LLDGKYDHIPETAFYMQGDIKDVFKAAENMERELAEKKAKEAAEAAINAAAAEAAAGNTTTQEAKSDTPAEKLTEFDLALKKGEDSLKAYKEFLEYAAIKENNVEAAVLLGCPNALEFYAVREELNKIRQPRASNFNALLENVPDAGDKRTQLALTITRQNNENKALSKIPQLSADHVKSMFQGTEVSLSDAYGYGSAVGVNADGASLASDPQKAYDTLKKFAAAVGGTVSQGFEEFKAERLLFDPFFAFAQAQASSGLHFEQWYDVYAAEAQTAMKNLASPKLPYKAYTDNGGKLVLDDWKQEQARKSLPLLGHSKETLSAFATFLARPNLTPFYQEYKKLLKL